MKNNHDIEKLIKKAEQPQRISPRWHEYYRGKIESSLKCSVTSIKDFSIWYTPGVAEPCRMINKDSSLAYKFTNKWNNVAIISDGSRVLGLGDIGPLASLPVMEGKSLLFKYLGGISAFPIVLDTKDPEKFIETVKIITPAFGGINLEDIENPKCFYILDRLREELDIPVWHDDQQGTASIELAGVINALKLVGKDINEAKFSIIGAGAANVALCRILFKAGVKEKNIVVTDSKGILHKGREDLEKNKKHNPYKWDLACRTNGDDKKSDTAEAIKGTDVMIAAAKPGPGTIKKEWISEMNKDAIVFAVANPVPEIWPWEAKEAGAGIVGTGRSDFENQINNSLGFPGIFRGTLDVNAKTITDEMTIAAAYSVAKTAEKKGLREDYIVPAMDEWEVFINEAVAVGLKAIEQGIARIELSESELRKSAEELISNSRKQTELQIKEGLIKKPPS